MFYLECSIFPKQIVKMKLFGRFLQPFCRKCGIWCAMPFNDEGLENKSNDTKAASRDNHRLWCYKHYASFDPMCDIIFATVRTSAKSCSVLWNVAKQYFTRQANSKHRKLRSKKKNASLLRAKNPLTFIYAKKVLKSGEVIDFSHVLMLCVDKKSVWRWYLHL